MKKSPTEYIVMGDDGKEYGPTPAKQIRLWVAEGRLDKKTPVKPGDARDWVFLGDVPEFVRLFAPPQMSRFNLSSSKGPLRAVLVPALAIGIYLLYRYLHRH
jgi:hypothetical protein